MAEKNIQETKSSVRISDDAIAAIAGLAATDIEGVSSMAGNLTNALIAKLGVKNFSKGVKVYLTGENVEIELSLNVEYGCSVPSVCAAVQKKVKEQVENMTGLNVQDVRIHIAGVDMENR